MIVMSITTPLSGTLPQHQLLKQNRFAALADDGETIEEKSSSSSTVEASRASASSRSGRRRRTGSTRASPPAISRKVCSSESKACSGQTFELSSAEAVRRVDLTIDSGAAEHVVGPYDLPHLETLPTTSNATYKMANGTTSVGLGEQRVQATTLAGQTCNFVAQVTDVQRPLMSVTRICDAGHTVFFNAQGGYIESTKTGEQIHFRRENNVYRVTVDVPGGDFQRPGVRP